MTSFYVMNATPIKNTAIANGTWLINYSFYLNGTNDAGEYDKLPYFMIQLLDGFNITIINRTAYESWILDVPVNNSSKMLKMVLDNEVIDLGLFTIDKTQIIIETEGEPGINKTIIINGTLKDNAGNPLANKNIKLLVNGEIVQNGSTNSNGKVSFTYTFNTIGNHEIQIFFEGDNSYNTMNPQKTSW